MDPNPTYRENVEAVFIACLRTFARRGRELREALRTDQNNEAPIETGAPDESLNIAKGQQRDSMIAEPITKGLNDPF